jgi:hypothetical protein
MRICYVRTERGMEGKGINNHPKVDTLDKLPLFFAFTY